MPRISSDPGNEDNDSGKGGGITVFLEVSVVPGLW